MDYVGYLGWHYIVLIDGVEVGEIWPGQVNVFDVSPGDHSLQVRLFGFLRQSEKRWFSVREGDVATFECHTGWNFYAQLRPASRKDLQGIEQAAPQPPTPRNLRKSED